MANNTSLSSKKSAGSLDPAYAKTSAGKQASSTRSTGSGFRKQNRAASSMAELMAKAGSSFNILQKGQQVEGTIKKLTPQEILMDIEAKGDALVIEYDKQNLENLLSFLKVGDRVSATVISAESEEGFPVVSLRRTLDDIIFEKFEKLVKGEETLEIEVGEVGRGGYFAVTSEGVRGFLPLSQVIDESGSLVGKKIQVKILEVDRSKKRVVFSQKALSYILNPDEIRKVVKKDDVVDGEITGVTPYGVFLSMNVSKNAKVEGFIHISEISYERIDNLDAQFKKGDKIRAQIIEVDTSNRRVNLSIKKTKKDTFLEAKEKYKVEGRIKGTVSKVGSRGAVIALEEGISGLIPSDKIPHFAESSRGKTSGYNVGDIVDCEVVEIDQRRRVIILSPVLKSVPIGYR